MSKKAVHQKYNDDALKHFGMCDEPFFGLVTSNQVDKVLITQDATSFVKIRNSFEFGISDARVKGRTESVKDSRKGLATEISSLLVVALVREERGERVVAVARHCAAGAERALVLAGRARRARGRTA
mgnify:CR=1 FL=1